MIHSQLLGLLALPFIRLELPGWGRIGGFCSALGPDVDPLWRDVPRKTVRGKRHGYWMDLDLSDWSQRLTWFLGRYHDLEIQLLIDHCVRPGERVVDVGANIGMVTLHAAWRVGPSGIVDAFEPNPDCCERIRATLARNQIRQVRLHPFGLSDEPAMLTLSVLQNHSGMGTLASVADDIHVTQMNEVAVRVGDGVLLEDPRPIALIKVDVEGFEVRVLRGMRETLRRFRPVVVTEVIGEWLERAGSGAGELLELMQGFGYRGFGMATSRGALGRRSLRLLPFPVCGEMPQGVSDVVWVPIGGSYSDGLRDHL